MTWRILHVEGMALAKTTCETQASGTVTGNYRLDCGRFLGVSGGWRPDPEAQGVCWSPPFC